MKRRSKPKRDERPISEIYREKYATLIGELVGIELLIARDMPPWARWVSMLAIALRIEEAAKTVFRERATPVRPTR